MIEPERGFSECFESEIRRWLIAHSAVQRSLHARR
jgi:hypothetical protein